MKLLHKNEQFSLKNNNSAINTIMEKINESIEKKETIFSHLIVDNIEIYENHEEYLEKKINYINKVEIVTRGPKEMLLETMESIHTYIDGALPAINQLVEESYVNFSKKTWEGINQLAEGMQWILQFNAFTKTASQHPSNWVGIEKGIHACEASFSQLINAVEVKDTILISDILSYEVIPAYNLLHKNLEMSLQDEEFMKNVN